MSHREAIAIRAFDTRRPIVAPSLHVSSNFNVRAKHTDQLASAWPRGNARAMTIVLQHRATPSLYSSSAQIC